MLTEKIQCNLNTHSGWIHRRPFPRRIVRVGVEVMAAIHPNLMIRNTLWLLDPRPSTTKLTKNLIWWCRGMQLTWMVQEGWVIIFDWNFELFGNECLENEFFLKSIWITWKFVCRLRHQEYHQSLWTCHSTQYHHFLKTILVSYNRINCPLSQPVLRDHLLREPCWTWWTVVPPTDTIDHVLHPLYLVEAALLILWVPEQEVGNKAILR